MRARNLQFFEAALNDRRGHNLVLIPLISAGSLKSTMQHIFRLMKL
ncbi:hypothetical protein CAter10_0452 [Collimonas arenae]|nr:hypothetical protein CAter10_0452 [Collimonas arenae]